MEQKDGVIFFDPGETERIELGAALRAVHAARKALGEAMLNHERCRQRYMETVDPDSLDFDYLHHDVLDTDDGPQMIAHDAYLGDQRCDAEIERAYRRGFAQGVAQSLKAMRAGADISQVERWWATVTGWRAWLVPGSFLAAAKRPPHYPDANSPRW